MVVKMVTYKEFKKLVCLRCLDGPFSMFSKERKLKAVNETITENENVIDCSPEESRLFIIDHLSELFPGEREQFEKVI